MRLVTRSDFDGLDLRRCCSSRWSTIDSIQFVHPKDLQDGKFEVTKNDDFLTNVPYRPRLRPLVRPSHATEVERIVGKTPIDFAGDCRIAPQRGTGRL